MHPGLNRLSTVTAAVKVGSRRATSEALTHGAHEKWVYMCALALGRIHRSVVVVQRQSFRNVRRSERLVELAIAFAEQKILPGQSQR